MVRVAPDDKKISISQSFQDYKGMVKNLPDHLSPVILQIPWKVRSTLFFRGTCKIWGKFGEFCGSKTSIDFEGKEKMSRIWWYFHSVGQLIRSVVIQSGPNQRCITHDSPTPSSRKCSEQRKCSKFGSKRKAGNIYRFSWTVSNIVISIMVFICNGSTL